MGEGHPPTQIWAYDGVTPGPVLRARIGERLSVEVENRLPLGTTVHFHGPRLPNAMDGVPGVTQEAIAPGGRFLYDFELKDAGTFWYHPHAMSAEQVGRGLAGVLIVEETRPVPADREILWVLQDWRLTKEAQFAGSFVNFHDAAHAGRLGNVVTVNGVVTESVPVRAGERIRLRIVNAASARVFALGFEGHAPMIVALDGHAVAPHAPDGGRVVLGPAQRADLIIDVAATPGGRFRVDDAFYPRQRYRLLDLACSDEPPLRTAPPGPVVAPAPNPLAEPDLAAAERIDVVFEGGAMGRIMRRPGGMETMRGMMARGAAWLVNGEAMTEGDGHHHHRPLATLKRGRSTVIAMRNETAWHHPIHLHGHVFRVVSRNGEPTRHREWRDTVMMAPDERVEIAFVADNPGRWMFHCHILEHQGAGMMAMIEVG